MFQGPRNNRFFERGRSVSALDPNNANAGIKDGADAEAANGHETGSINRNKVEIEILEPKRPPDAKTKQRIQQEYEEL